MVNSERVDELREGSSYSSSSSSSILSFAPQDAVAGQKRISGNSYVGKNRLFEDEDDDKYEDDRMPLRRNYT